MANMKKFNRSAVGHMLEHYDRSDLEAAKKNKNIDPSRTHLNYNLLEDFCPGAKNETQRERMEKILSRVKCLKRKNVNVMCAWTVTLPKDYTGDPKKFFEAAYKFLTERYFGNDQDKNKNVISAYVHMDETSPHLHFAFVPVVKDRKTGKEKVSAKEMIALKDLQTFHEDFQKFIDKNIDSPCSVVNEATLDGNKSISELKAETNYNKKNEMLQEVADLKTETENLKENVYLLRATQNELQDSIKNLRLQLADLQKEKEKVAALEAKKERLKKEVKKYSDENLTRKILELYEDCKTAQRWNYDREDSTSFETLEEACEIRFNRNGEKFIDYDMEQLENIIGIEEAWKIGDVILEESETAIRKEKGLLR